MLANLTRIFVTDVKFIKGEIVCLINSEKSDLIYLLSCV